MAVIRRTIDGDLECYKKSLSPSGIPPSQTAPETVSLLQAPVHNAKYASAIVIQGRNVYNRDKPKSRVAHYSNQLPNTHYQVGLINLKLNITVFNYLFIM